MSMVINHNIPGLTSCSDLAAAHENLVKAIEKFSTGLRVNSATDDAAGLAVSEKLRAQMKGVDQAIANSQDGINLTQIADGALAETQDILHRMRELSVQAANGSLTWQDRSYIQVEVSELREEIDRIADTTQFNKKKLLNGNAAAQWSSDKSTTKAIIRGSLTDVNQFGQKTSFEGNYKIDILAVPGEGMVMKSKIFTFIDPEETYGYVGSGMYLDEEDSQITADEAAQLLNGGFYSLGLQNVETGEVTRVTLDATDGGLFTMKQVAARLNENLAEDSEYEFYFDDSAQALAVRSEGHDFHLTGAQSTIEKLFGVTAVPGKHISGTRPTEDLHFIREWSSSPDDVDISVNGTYKISGTMNSITIRAGTKATIVLEDVSVDTSGAGNDPTMGSPYGFSALKIEDGAEVELILAGDTSLKSGYGRGGIEVEEGSTVRIYESEEGGTLEANGGTCAAGIGSAANFSSTSTHHSGDVVIYGGTVRANGGSSAAGIGGGLYGDGGKVAIHGGDVRAVGQSGAAGIGFGQAGHVDQKGGGEILITGGTVYAEGGWGGAGIGGGTNSNNTADINAGKITITGGDITAVGGRGGAGIGGGNQNFEDMEINISGGTINATGGGGAAGIGGGGGGTSSGTNYNVGTGGKITITGGDITATGGGEYGGSGAGIGGGSQAVGGEIVIAGGTITATGGDYGSGGQGGAAGVGGGSGNKATGGEIYIVDGVLTAQGGYGAAGIGGGGGSSGGSSGSYDTQYWGAAGGEIYIYGGKVNATGGISGAGIGGGTFGYSGTIRVQDGLYGTDVIATKGADDSKSDTDPMRKQHDIGHGDHILDEKDREEGGSVDTTADIDAPGIVALDSIWSDTQVREKIAEGGTALSQLRQLFDDTGKSLVSDPQTITITQSDGTQSRVTLYSDDTLNSTVQKVVQALNGGNGNRTSTGSTAGGSGSSGSSGTENSGSGSSGNSNALNAGLLGASSSTPLLGAGSSDSSGSSSSSGSGGKKQSNVSPIENYYAAYVSPGGATPGTSESVEGTLVMRSLPCGVDGALAFEGSRELLESLALNKIQEARENQFIVNITDAHTGEVVVRDIKITGNKLNGVLHKNVDIEFDPMAGIEVKWNDEQKQFDYSAKKYTTYLHLADNATTLQVGADEGDELDISIGDMSVHALGLDLVNVTNRTSAVRAITIIDNANDRVSSQRAKLGAYQNRLERTIGRLATANENLTVSEGRIRDTDMAREAMNYAKLQILLQSGTSMVTQANQLPRNVLGLMQ
ncbi:MAG: hypothetical protein K5841_08015 [Fretibacterium sp.]|nr:hypothetical protein [Fretibacterium sp.]